MTVKRAWMLLGALGLCIVPRGVAASFSSGPERVALIELYTSEGCSSCPPADRWLGELCDDPRLWREFVPVAFHVNYWDYIGWRDRFASKAFTERQYALAHSWRSGQVYTPCFVRDGQEWRARDLGRPDADAPGELTASYANGHLQVTFRPAHRGGEYVAVGALLGGGITSNVKAGENSGRKLAHEFVALTLQSSPMGAGDEGLLTADVVLDSKDTPVTPRRALAVWVTRRGELAPVQATGGWLE